MLPRPANFQDSQQLKAISIPKRNVSGNTGYPLVLSKQAPTASSPFQTSGINNDHRPENYTSLERSLGIVKIKRKDKLEGKVKELFSKSSGIIRPQAFSDSKWGLLTV